MRTEGKRKERNLQQGMGEVGGGGVLPYTSCPTITHTTFKHLWLGVKESKKLLPEPICSYKELMLERSVLKLFRVAYLHHQLNY